MSDELGMRKVRDQTFESTILHAGSNTPHTLGLCGWNNGSKATILSGSVLPVPRSKCQAKTVTPESLIFLPPISDTLAGPDTQVETGEDQVNQPVPRVSIWLI